MGHFIYNIFIMPLELLFQFVYVCSNSVASNPGVCIIAISIVMNLLVLPLYKRADDVQERERQKQKEMEPWVKHIRRTFRGDERFMMLSTYYRQQNYHPLYAVKSSLSLLLQIPFFIAAYHFLSNLSALNGQAFLFLSDLGEPDALLSIGAVSVNILPILMTLINFASGAIYTKGFPVREKLQLYGVAVIFLVLLYPSPSGLVFYWTLNNLFSLGKNLFFKVIPHPQTVLRWLVAFLGTGLSLFVFTNSLDVRFAGKLFFVCLMILCLFPLLWSWLPPEEKQKIHVPKLAVAGDAQGRRVFFLSALILVLLCGAYIPSSVMAASPSEFLSAEHSSLYLILNTLSLYAGLFLWVSVFYLLAKEKSKPAFSCVLWLLVGISLVDFLFFGKDYGTLSIMLVYDEKPVWEAAGIFINVAVLLAVTVLFFLLLKKFPKIAERLCPVFLAGIVCVSVYNCVGIVKECTEARELREAGDYSETDKIIPLSKEGNNVVVIMLDRAISGFVPYIFNEKTELYEQFDGFTYYPNTLAYSICTNMATPALFGGYDYTPEAINSRTDKLLVDEQNEALTVMPKLFLDNGYDVTVCDPPYAGYSWVPDLSIYDEYEGIHAYITEDKYRETYRAKMEEEYPESGLGESNQENNFYFHSLFRIAPTFAKFLFYKSGSYCAANQNPIDGTFAGKYSTLLNLGAITEIREGNSDTFLMLQNSVTHEPSELSVPDYSLIPSELSPYDYYAENQYLTLEGREVIISTDAQLIHYQTNVAALMALGDWLDYLKENDVYDNTRIIIVSDHGRWLYNFSDMILANGVDVEAFNSVLLCKDFGDTGELATSDAFMTTADVPTLATDGVIEDPVNPFTGKAINSDAKEQPQKITTSDLWELDTNNGVTFDTSDGRWFAVQDNIFDVSNWTEITE